MPPSNPPPTIPPELLKAGTSKMTDLDWTFRHVSALTCSGCRSRAIVHEGKGGKGDERFKCSSCSRTFGMGNIQKLRASLSTRSVSGLFSKTVSGASKTIANAHVGIARAHVAAHVGGANAPARSEGVDTSMQGATVTARQQQEKIDSSTTNATVIIDGKRQIVPPTTSEEEEEQPMMEESNEESGDTDMTDAGAEPSQQQQLKQQTEKEKEKQQQKEKQLWKEHQLQKEQQQLKENQLQKEHQLQKEQQQQKERHQQQQQEQQQKQNQEEIRTTEAGTASSMWAPEALSLCLSSESEVSSTKEIGEHVANTAPCSWTIGATGHPGSRKRARLSVLQHLRKADSEDELELLKEQCAQYSVLIRKLTQRVDRLERAAKEKKTVRFNDQICLNFNRQQQRGNTEVPHSVEEELNSQQSKPTPGMTSTPVQVLPSPTKPLWSAVVTKRQRKQMRRHVPEESAPPSQVTNPAKTVRAQRSPAPVSSIQPVTEIAADTAIQELVARMRPRNKDVLTPNRKPLPMSHVYLAGRRCAKGQWRETLRKLGISTRAVPEIQFVGTSIVDLWVYAQHAPQIRERLAASGFKFEQFEPTSPSAIARPDLSVTSRAKHAQAAYLNRLQRTVEACTNESVRSHAEVLIRSLNPDSRSPPRAPTTVDDNPSTETASSTVPGSADNTPANCDMEI